MRQKERKMSETVPRLGGEKNQHTLLGRESSSRSQALRQPACAKEKEEEQRDMSCLA